MRKAFKNHVEMTGYNVVKNNRQNEQRNRK